MRKFNLKMTITFIFEVIIPIICIPILPNFFPGCSAVEAFIAGTTISIFIAIWEFRYRFHEKCEEYSIYLSESKQNFDYIYRQLKFVQSVHEFQDIIDKVSHPYFKKQITIEFEKNLYDFIQTNRALINQYVETTPYSNNTFGVEGLLWTKNSIWAVSSIEDYWERDNFINDYLNKQYFMIKNKKIEIVRIFIAPKQKLKKMDKILKNQKENGIKIYYIDSESEYFNKDWIKEDFLIQDNLLLVNLQSQSHKYEQAGKEIITTDETLVYQKIQIFRKMMENAIKY